MLRINLLPKLPKGSFYGWTEYGVNILDQEAICQGVLLPADDPIWDEMGKVITTPILRKIYTE
jgi:hypothetical protein